MGREWADDTFVHTRLLYARAHPRLNHRKAVSRRSLADVRPRPTNRAVDIDV